MVMSQTASGAPTAVIRVERVPDEPMIPVGVSAVVMTLLVVTLISWLAARYLNWAMAPRRFRLRVAAAGVLPVGILIAVIVAAGMSSEPSIAAAAGSLSRIPSEGRLLMLAMLITGLAVSWSRAWRRRNHDERQANAALEVFQ